MEFGDCNASVGVGGLCFGVGGFCSDGCVESCCVGVSRCGVNGAAIVVWLLVSCP